MVRSICLAVCLGALVSFGVGGTGSSAASKTAAKAGVASRAALYVCTHCRVGSDKPGKCPLCRAEMKKAGTYICPTCDTTSNKPGVCPCGKKYVKTALAGIKCHACGYYISKEARGCPICRARKAKKSAH